VPHRLGYALTAQCIRGFLQTYRKRFGTNEVVELTLYGDHAILNVPVTGKARQSVGNEHPSCRTAATTSASWPKSTGNSSSAAPGTST
jgi:hypothetical protein